MFRTCPLLPLVYNEMSGVVTLMRCVKHADCRRQRAACSAPGNSDQAGRTADPASSFFLLITISNILLTRLSATWVVVLLTFSSAFCTLVRRYDNCHGADATFIKLPVANPGWWCRILPASPQGSPLRNCKANKNRAEWNCNPLVPLSDGSNLVLNFNGGRDWRFELGPLSQQHWKLSLLIPELERCSGRASLLLCERFLHVWDRNLLMFLTC